VTLALCVQLGEAEVEAMELERGYQCFRMGMGRVDLFIH
jgi:hypothetical protein